MTMKKFLLLSCAVLLSLSQLLAQESTFKQGDKVVNLGIGLGSSFYASWYTSQTPTITGSLDYCIKNVISDKGGIGVGGYVGYSSAKYDQYWKTSNFLIGGRGSFHYALVKNLDTYAGLLLGYNVFNTKTYGSYSGYYSTASSGVAYAWFAGGRYYFTNSIAGLAELGLGNYYPYLTLGVSFKF